MAREMFRVTVGLAGLVMGITGCAGGGDDASAEGASRQGGTLRVIGSSDVEHLDPASVSSVGAYGLARTFARTLFGTRASNDFQETVPVRPDVAVRLPTRENGDISKDRRTYTVRLRDGVQWNTSPPRPVTAPDFVRGFERLCNPASPSSGKGYYLSTLKGMDEFCRGFGSVDAKNAGAIAAYQRDHDIEGVSAKDDRTLVFKLKRPASDFLNLLSLPFTAAAPKEYDAYVPDSAEFRQHTISNGPYQITEYRPGLSYVLSHNPAWRAASDPSASATSPRSGSRSGRTRRRPSSSRSSRASPTSRGTSPSRRPPSRTCGTTRASRSGRRRTTAPTSSSTCAAPTTAARSATGPSGRPWSTPSTAAPSSRSSAGRRWRSPCTR